MTKKRLLPILLVCLVVVGAVCLALFGANSPFKLDKGDSGGESYELTKEDKAFVEAFNNGEVEPVTTPIGIDVDYDKNAKVGDTFDVTISTNENPGICAAQFTLAYNKSVLECTNVELGTVINKMNVKVSNLDSVEGVKVAGASISPVTVTGTIATVTFKVIKEGEYDFKIKDTCFYDAYENNIQITTDFDIEEVKDDSNNTDDGTDTDGGNNTVINEPGKNDTLDETTFKDTKKSWAKEYIEKAADKGLVNGVGNNLYEPNKGMTRAEFVTILYRSEVSGLKDGAKNYSGKMPFKDTASGKWYSAAVVWASKNKIVNGVGGGKFDPDSGVTREQIATILFRLAGEKQGGELMYFTIYDSTFKDSGKVSSWAKNGVYWAVFNEIFCGKNEASIKNYLYPRDFADRAQIAVMMVKYGEYKEAA